MAPEISECPDRSSSQVPVHQLEATAPSVHLDFSLLTAQQPGPALGEATLGYPSPARDCNILHLPVSIFRELQMEVRRK